MFFRKKPSCDVIREVESRIDPITGAYNRKGLYAGIKDKIIKDIEFSIIYITINNFNVINDSYGHAYGDELLRRIARRLERRNGQNGIVSRVGGAEYVVVIDGTEDAQIVADRLLDAIRQKIIIDVGESRLVCHVDGYAGVAIYPRDATDYESLIKFADIALREAIANMSKQSYVFSLEMLETINRQMHIKNLIKEGLAKELFYICYQPQYELKQKKLRGFEALLRLKTEDGVIISPGEFIPVAEKSDLIMQIDDYVLERVMNEFKDAVLLNSDLIVSVNVSAHNFSDVMFSDKVKRLLKETEFPPQNLEIEITEYCMVSSMNRTSNNIAALKELGVGIALDDFGTGYSSLNYLSKLPFDLLKIDKSLIDDIDNNPMRRAFVGDVISMGQHMDCEVIAEGVENENQIKVLCEDGCNYMQGYVWGKPLSYEDALGLVMK